MKHCLLAFPLLVLAGCHGGATGYKPTPPPKIEAVSTSVKSADLMPLGVGSTWVYAMHVEQTQNGRPPGNNDDVVSYRVASQRGDGGALLLMEQSGKVVDRQEWRPSADGLYQLTGGPKGAPYTPPQPIAMLPLEAGKKFHWAGKGVMANGKLTSGDASSEILAPQPVYTGMKGMETMSAIPVVTRTKYPGGQSESTSWFHPGIGLVRYRQESTDGGRHTVILLTLTDHTKK